ncbi:hypothetical protein MAC_04430 [Metarhizium acridum CQMa 102]|uniref:Aminoglycoside phosphotransferase domain-containing protein n=2 Tax=Metarhizium acridum TaxID=92637 RepID=E9E3I2_METAQ|nr:uncharacterized protein MAC_04430 [Metarhizium acridum CQMa 102]EFY89575.1 hypothetical protein MAC_04430 [Metarhizium acridum CQMa 102]
MRAIRAAGVPCPKVISYGEHPHTPWAPVSILMTRLPGEELDVAYEHLSALQRNTVTMELRTILEAIRSWKNPWGRRICSISSGPIRSIRVPNHVVRPCESEDEFQEQILSTASSHSFKTRDEDETTLATARAMPLQHDVDFTHGDFALHNILVYNGRVSGFIDWESAGWYPEYWEFTTPLRWTSRDSEKGSLFLQLGGHRYEKELESELAIRTLTVDSWISV